MHCRSGLGFPPPAYGVDAKAAAEGLALREKLGSTGFGGGVAIPHARLAGIDAIRGVVATLAKPIDMDAIDELPVVTSHADGQPMAARFHCR